MLTWPRLPPFLELATIGAGYAAYRLVVLALPAGHHAAFTHAAQLWRAERWLHLNLEPTLNHLLSAHPTVAVAVGYYYGLLHFIAAPLLLAWLYRRRAAAFPRLRSALVVTTSAANIVFWTWPAAPPRFSVPGMTDTLVTHDILGAAHPHGTTSLVNSYAAMPSLHMAWAAWCSLAVITISHSRWRHLAWLYPAATTFAVLASANHFLLDVVVGIIITVLGMLATSRTSFPKLVHISKDAATAPHQPRNLSSSPLATVVRLDEDTEAMPHHHHGIERILHTKAELRRWQKRGWLYPKDRPPQACS